MNNSGRANRRGKYDIPGWMYLSEGTHRPHQKPNMIRSTEFISRNSVWNTQNSSPVWGKCCMRDSVQDFKLLKKYYRSLCLKTTWRSQSLIIYKLWIRFIKYESNPGIMSIHHQWVCYDMKNNNKLQHEMSHWIQ